MQVKEEIIINLRQTKRAGIENLLQWMDENGFYDAPCSTKYHFATPGGLAEHTRNVINAAASLLQAFYIFGERPITDDFINSVVICAALHDLGKCGQFGKPNYTLNEELPFPVFETNKELLYIPHEVRSIAIASQFIELTEEEQFAILYHNGLYGELQSVKNHETELYMILHFADMWACRVMEKEKKQ